MTGAQLQRERETIAQALDTSVPPAYIRPPPREEAADVARRFGELAPYGSPPALDALQERLAPLQGRQTHVLSFRLAQIRLALAHAQRYHGRDYDPTEAFAVSPHWRHRWEATISGALFPAFV